MTTLALTTTYQKAADSIQAMQNVGSGTAIVYIGGEPSANTDRGFYLKSGDAILGDSWGSGEVWVRLANSEPVTIVFN